MIHPVSNWWSAKKTKRLALLKHVRSSREQSTRKNYQSSWESCKMQIASIQMYRYPRARVISIASRKLSGSESLRLPLVVTEAEERFPPQQWLNTIHWPTLFVLIKIDGSYCSDPLIRPTSITRKGSIDFGFDR